MRPALIFPDPRAAIADLLAGLLADEGEDVTVGVAMPASWTPGGSKPHVMVSSDGARATWPIVERSTVRLAAHAETTAEADRLLRVAHALLLAAEPSGPISYVRYLSGPLCDTDPDNGAEMAAGTVAVGCRPALLSAGS